MWVTDLARLVFVCVMKGLLCNMIRVSSWASFLFGLRGLCALSVLVDVMSFFT